MIVIRWIGEHANKVRSAIWQIILALVVFGAFAIEDHQLAVLGMALDAVLALFVETNTVSKVRVGERIDAEVKRETGIIRRDGP